MNVLSFKVVWKGIIDAFDVRDRRVGYVIGTGASTSMAPTAHGAASLQVDIASGNYSKNGADASTSYAGGNITPTGADPTNPRVDIVFMNSAGTLATTAGTAAAIVPGVSGPVPPVWPAGCCPLAIAFIPANATDYTTGGYVLDARVFGVVPFIDATVTADGLMAQADKRAITGVASVNATGAMAPDFSVGGLTKEWATTGNVTGITLTNGVAHQWHAITIKYGGAHTIVFTTTVLWAGGTTPTFTSVNGKYDVVTLYYDGTNWLGEFSGNH